MTLPIVDLVLDLLRRDPTGDQRFVWIPKAEEGLVELLDAIFVYPADPRLAIDDLLRTICALELELRSPQTAARLRTILICDPRVVAACDVKSRSDELRARQERWSGSDATKQAPRFGVAAPRGTVTAASLLDPGIGRARGAPRRRRT